jgi:uncharacterized XkdX family phage protein
MDWLEICTTYYNKGYYDSTSLKVFTVKGKITAAEYESITGIPYAE